MKNERYLESLMAFNFRVLSKGYVSTSEPNSIISLSEKLFFIKIFMSNCKEIYQRHDFEIINESYIQSMDVIRSNVENIKSLVNLSNIPVKLVDYNPNISNVIDKLTCTSMNVFNIERVPIDEGEIYYVGISGDEFILTESKGISPDEIMTSENGIDYYHNVSESIMAYVMDCFAMHAVVSFKITRDELNLDISKIEIGYRGNVQDVNSLIVALKFNRYNTIINECIDVDEMSAMFESIIPRPLDTGTSTRLSLEKLFENDILLEYPKDSYSEYLNFLDRLISSRYVTKFNMTLYRVGDDMTLYEIIEKAVKLGVKVSINVELCASGESINRVWFKRLDELGVDVYAYKSGDVKVHCKLTSIELITGDVITQIGTGNYHSKTSKEYCDLSLITTNPVIGKHVENVFNLLREEDYEEFDESVLVTRNNAREELISLIDREGKLGVDGYIAIKCNALDDDEIISHLDSAASNGCTVELCIRGVCTWIPNYNKVVVKSLVWGKLEHSRMYCFGLQDPDIYIGSLDMITSKLDGRIEVLVRVESIDVKVQCIDYINTYTADVEHSWIMTDKGNYVKAGEI